MIHNTKSGSISFEFQILKIIHCKKQLFEVAYEKHLRIDCPRNVEFRDLPEFHRRWILWKMLLSHNFIMKTKSGPFMLKLNCNKKYNQVSNFVKMLQIGNVPFVQLILRLPLWKIFSSNQLIFQLVKIVENCPEGVIWINW